MNKFNPSQFTILMVDDNPKNLQLLGNMLRNEGYQLEFATSGPTALAWFEKKIFDLVLLDIMMPDMSGFEVCEKLRSDHKQDDIPVIFLTAKTEKESILQGFSLGAQDYVTKPFDTSELLARVRTHLELRFSKEQLKNMNQILEDKVKERTHELQEAYHKIQKANEELLILDQAKTEFLHIISHEIRTPLNGIKGSLELIKEYSHENTIATLFEILDASVTRLEKFLITALKITQLKVGKSELDLQALPFDLIINTTLIKLKHKLEKKFLQTITYIQPNDNIIIGDFEMLSTCLTTILDNAINYSPEYGKITINTSASENILTMEIKDEGPGFSQKAQETLFSLFAPGDKHINENEGLELALSKLIIDAHSGTIKAYNSDGGGAIVKLSFPKVLN